MMDVSDTPNKNDILLEDTSKYKIRNLLKTPASENPYNTFIGIDYTALLTQNITPETFKQVITKYLYSFNCQITGMEQITNTKGVSMLNIKTREEEFSV